MPALYVAIAVVVLIGLYVAITYNTLVRLRQHCKESFSGIETELKRRYDLIPNLVETVKGYARHEREVLQSVIEARNKAVASWMLPAASARTQSRSPVAAPGRSALSRPIGCRRWRECRPKRPQGPSRCGFAAGVTHCRSQTTASTA